MACEPEIDNVSLIFDRLTDIGFHEELKLRKLRNSPDDIVAEPDVIQRNIHLRDAAFNPVKSRHVLAPFEQQKGASSDMDETPLFPWFYEFILAFTKDSCKAGCQLSLPVNSEIFK